MRQPVHRRQNPTPASIENPFYPDQLPLRTDNDLVTIVDGGQPASGELLYLAGRVMDTSSVPLTGIAIEISECDANGISALRGFKAG